MKTHINTLSVMLLYLRHLQVTNVGNSELSMSDFPEFDFMNINNLQKSTQDWLHFIIRS